jgi:hypothetical protein
MRVDMRGGIDGRARTAKEAKDGHGHPGGDHHAGQRRHSPRDIEVLRRIAGQEHRREGLRQPRRPARRAGVPQRHARRVAGCHAQGSPRSGGHGQHHRHLRNAARSEVAVSDRQHRDALCHGLAGLEERAGRRRKPAELARHHGRFLATSYSDHARMATGWSRAASWSTATSSRPSRTSSSTYACIRSRRRPIRRNSSG